MAVEGRWLGLTGVLLSAAEWGTAMAGFAPHRRALVSVVLAMILAAFAGLPMSAYALGTWTSQTSGSVANGFLGITFFDATHGWAVGGNGTIRYTTDGGAHWNTPTSPAASALSSVAFPDAMHGWAVGNSGTILATTDGGAHWAAQNSNTTNWLMSVAFTDASHGWAVGNGGTMVRTINGGATGRRRHSPVWRLPR